jgi:hypothetical protein
LKALVRSEKNFKAVERLGIEVVHGSHSDLSLITECCKNADIVLNAADADDLYLTNAVLTGLKTRKDKSAPAILLHTSGTGLVVDNAEGVFTDYAKKVWDVSIKDLTLKLDRSPSLGRLC